jgi:hypothetical protein
MQIGCKQKKILYLAMAIILNTLSMMGQELNKMQYFDDLTNKDKQPLLAQATNPSTS